VELGCHESSTRRRWGLRFERVSNHPAWEMQAERQVYATTIKRKAAPGYRPSLVLSNRPDAVALTMLDPFLFNLFICAAIFVDYIEI
jgi:hypothetical protein